MPQSSIGAATDSQLFAAFDRSINLQNNAPYIARTLEGDTNFAIFFLVQCQDGTYTTKSSTPCSDDAPNVKSTTTVLSQYGISQTIVHPVASLVWNDASMHRLIAGWHRD